MKTRSNMPLYVVETADIEHLRDDQIDMLSCGDYLVKKTGNQRHAYKVTYKEDKHGVCLSYFACGYSETISYDYVGGHWVFNSKDVSMTNQLEQIKDADEHNRFVEGDFEMETITGVTQTYGKWSLSGTHLMIVLCFDIDNGVEFTSSDDFASITNIPQWIMDKIVSVFGYGGVVRQAVSFFSKTTTASQSGAVTLFKETSSKLVIHNSTGLTMSDDRAVRITFDLLIDND